MLEANYSITSSDPESIRLQIITAERRRIEKDIIRNLETLQDELKNDDTPYFQERFKNALNNSQFFEKSHVDTEQMEAASFAAGGVKNYSQGNLRLRTELHSNLLSQYSKLLQDEAVGELSHREEKIKNAILSAINTDNVSVSHLISDFLINIEGKSQDKEHNFENLIERFSRNLFDVMIQYPLGSAARLERFEKNDTKYEFMYLNSLYVGSNEKISPYRVLDLILCPPDTDDDFKKRFVKIIDNVLKLEKKDILTGVVSIVPIIGRVSGLFEKLYDYLLRPEYVVDNLVKELNSKANEKSNENSCNKNILEINEDIKNLKDIIINAVLKAANIEWVFLLILDKKIRLINNAINNNTRYFSHFIKELVDITKQKELGNISDEVEKAKEIAHIVSDIENFLK